MSVIKSESYNNRAKREKKRKRKKWRERDEERWRQNPQQNEMKKNPSHGVSFFLRLLFCFSKFLRHKKKHIITHSYLSFCMFLRFNSLFLCFTLTLISLSISYFILPGVSSYLSHCNSNITIKRKIKTWAKLFFFCFTTAQNLKKTAPAR